MGMIDRYRKTGGFVQLVALVETCPPAKQEKFLEIIKAEDPRWSDAVRTKLLSIEKIYAWSNETLAEIFGTLQDLTVAVALHAADETMKGRINSYFTHGRKRKIEDLFGTQMPSQQEIAATHMKIIETVRKMEQDGSIRFEKIDAALAIEDEIEAMLAKMPMPGETASPGSSLDFSGFEVDTGIHRNFEVISSTAPGVADANSESRVMEIQALKKRIAEMSKENAVLRHELSMARSKLDQIKKIA
ncbi:MAG: FliG C-terminal domain-containing protein [Bdellovibrionota bacterium]